MVASQDFQVKTIGMEGGSVRKCLLTCFYTGGDATTAKELLYPPESSRVSIPESDLGKGTILMRCTGTENKAILAQVPFVDNEAVYRLLGPSLFGEGEGDEDDEETHHVISDEQTPLSVEQAQKTTEDLPEAASVSPNIERRLKSEDIHIDTLVQAWNAGINTVAKIEGFFKMSHGEAYKAYNRVKTLSKESVSEE